MLPQEVLDKLELLPPNPGVYLFKDKKGEVVYVGKAKSLRSRVRSYFQAGGGDNRYFIPILQTTIGDLETIVTGSEKEAMILENNLIKDHKPRYNVKLRDDKEYLSLRLDGKHPWPRLDVVRKPSIDGARYFGPYHSATAARRTLHLINKHFQLRTCSDGELTTRKRPCLQYQIKRCPAPCVYPVDSAWYGEQVQSVALFLDGRHDELSRVLDDRMRTSAREMRFELAAVYRDQLKAIDKVREEQRVVSTDLADRDVLGLYRDGDLVELALLYIRGGKLADVDSFSIKHAEIPDEEIVAAFLAQHYGGAQVREAKPPAMPENAAPIDTAAAGVSDTLETSRDAEEGTFVPIPNEVLLPIEPEGVAGIAEWLSECAGHKIALLHPKRGPRVDLVALATENARHAFLEKRRTLDDIGERLKQMQERLRLPTVPHRIECCDISHLGGGDTVGAVVAMLDGVPDKKRYRTFHVRGATGQGAAQGDDYAAMYEVLARRFRRGIAERRVAPDVAEVTAREESGLPLDGDTRAAEGDGEANASEAAAAGENAWELPDLFVVDGGRGQLAVALAAAHDLGLHDLAIVGLAKEKENVMGELLVDRVYLPGQKNPIPLKSNSAALFFLARLRDEAHRSSNRSREKLGKARRFKSDLDDVAGLGPKTRKALLIHLGSLTAIKRADDAAILAVPGVTARHLKALRAVFEASSEPAPVEPVADAAQPLEPANGGES